MSVRAHGGRITQVREVAAQDLYRSMMDAIQQMARLTHAAAARCAGGDTV